jgi:hypothetical protein
MLGVSSIIDLWRGLAQTLAITGRIYQFGGGKAATVIGVFLAMVPVPAAIASEYESVASSPATPAFMMAGFIALPFSCGAS